MGLRSRFHPGWHMHVWQCCWFWFVGERMRLDCRFCRWFRDRNGLGLQGNAFPVEGSCCLRCITLTFFVFTRNGSNNPLAVGDLLGLCLGTFFACTHGIDDPACHGVKAIENAILNAANVATHVYVGGVRLFTCIGIGAVATLFGIHVLGLHILQYRHIVEVLSITRLFLVRFCPDSCNVLSHGSCPCWLLSYIIKRSFIL